MNRVWAHGVVDWGQTTGRTHWFSGDAGHNRESWVDVDMGGSSRRHGCNLEEDEWFFVNIYMMMMINMELNLEK